MNEGIIGRRVQWWTCGLKGANPHATPVNEYRFGDTEEIVGERVVDAILATGIVRAWKNPETPNCGLLPEFLVELVDPGTVAARELGGWLLWISTAACRTVPTEEPDIRHTRQGQAYRLDRLAAQVDTQGARLTRLEAELGILKQLRAGTDCLFEEGDYTGGVHRPGWRRDEGIARWTKLVVHATGTWQLVVEQDESRACPWFAVGFLSPRKHHFPVDQGLELLTVAAAAVEGAWALAVENGDVDAMVKTLEPGSRKA